MKLYKVVYDNGLKIEEHNSNDLRIIGTDSVVSKYGTLYNNNFYTTREAARHDINKEYWKISENEKYIVTNKTFINA